MESGEYTGEQEKKTINRISNNYYYFNSKREPLKIDCRT